MCVCVCLQVAFSQTTVKYKWVRTDMQDMNKTCFTLQEVYETLFNVKNKLDIYLPKAKLPLSLSLFPCTPFLSPPLPYPHVQACTHRLTHNLQMYCAVV